MTAYAFDRRFLRSMRRPGFSALPPFLADDFTGKGDTTTIPVSNGIGISASGGSGVTWTEIEGNSTITSGAWQCQAVPTNSRIRAAVGTANVDGMVLCPTAANVVGLNINVKDNINFWAAYKISGRLRIYEVTAGVVTQRADAAITVANNDLVRLMRENGTTVRAYHYNPTTGIVTTVVYASATANASEVGVALDGNQGGRVSKCQFFNVL